MEEDFQNGKGDIEQQIERFDGRGLERERSGLSTCFFYNLSVGKHIVSDISSADKTLDFVLRSTTNTTIP